MNLATRQYRRVMMRLGFKPFAVSPVAVHVREGEGAVDVAFVVSYRWWSTDEDRAVAASVAGISALEAARAVTGGEWKARRISDEEFGK